MDCPALASVRAKIARAEHHFRDINSSIRSVLGEPNSRGEATIKVDLQRKEIVVRMLKPEPLDPSFPLIVGDCIHNLRSALDHLVVQLALLNHASRDDAAKTFFPICLTSKEFEKRTKRLIKPFISSRAFTEIEDGQPYKAYDPPIEGADIWILHKLDIVDKHSLLIVAAQKFAATHFVITGPSGERFEKSVTEPKWKTLEQGAEIIRFNIAHAFHAPGKVHVNVKTITAVQFADNRLPCDGVLVQDAINQCFGIVGATVKDFGKLFFGE